MALNKQKILSDLGNVMTQLQSADCGCMGKLFSNQNGCQEGAPIIGHQPSEGFNGCGGSRHGCCQGHGGCNMNYGMGFGTSGAGEPHVSNRSCMGQCNPRQMYTETYNYLNQNLMQPTIKEVYEDLKGITPENTVMNNAMASKMGMLPQGGNAIQGDNSMQDYTPMNGNTSMQQNQMMNNQAAMPGNMNMLQSQMQGSLGYQNSDSMQPSQPSGYVPKMGGDSMNNPMGLYSNQMDQNMSNQNMSQIHGMGPQIANMMKSVTGTKPSMSSPQGSPMPGTMLIDAPHSPHGKVGVTPLNTTGNNMTDGHYNLDTRAPNHSNQVMYHPPTQYVTDVNMANEFNQTPQTNMTSGLHMNGQNMSDCNPNSHNNYTFNGNMHSSFQNADGNKNNLNPVTPQMGLANQNYGQHTQGIKKFNEMFPGVMSGDLGFDPMAIAIQMNPANHRSAAMATMQKMMSGNKGGINTPIAGVNTNVANVTQVLASNQQNNQPINGQTLYQQSNIDDTPTRTNQQYANIMNTSSLTSQPNLTQQLYNVNQVPPKEASNVNQQAVYTANIGAPMMSLRDPSQQLQAQHQPLQLQQQQTNTNTRTSIPQSQVEPETNALTQQQLLANQMMIQDPIFPIDTSRFQPPPNMRRDRSYQYNTLGQPVEILPAKLFQSNLETNLPQTLSPQPVTGPHRKDIDRFNVKSTVSKTSLMGNRPIGKTPSRGQLQNIYNQYKGSLSSTQQHIRTNQQNGTFSEGKIVQRGNLNPNPVPLSAPLEVVGGDTAANSQDMQYQILNKGQIMQNGGDVSTTKPHGDANPTKEPSMKQGNCRNGLQDMTYSTYPTSAAAWSFHGNAAQRAQFSSGYRYRYTRAR